MPFWHQKNRLCYNSRLTEHEFRCVIDDYCKGISASQSSAEFKEAGMSISRQTISKYFDGISHIILNDRGTYPWWSVNNWQELSDEQLNDIRDAVYDHHRIVGKMRDEFKTLYGKPISVDTETYIQVLRDMSKKMNGLPKQTFIVHLARACELALHIEAGFFHLRIWCSDLLTSRSALRGQNFSAQSLSMSWG